MNVTFKGKVRVKIELEPAEFHLLQEIFRYMGWDEKGSFESVRRLARDLYNNAAQQANNAKAERRTT